MKRLLSLLLLAAVALGQEICRRPTPQGPVTNKVQGDGGFFIDMSSAKSMYYRPRQNYLVRIRSSTGTPITEVALVAVLEGSLDDSKHAGSFEMPPNENGNWDLDFNGRIVPAACTNVTFAGRFPAGSRKSEVFTLWKSPPEVGYGCILFKATVTEPSGLWYKDDDRLTVRVCEDPNSIADKVVDCCACGVAKYQLQFKGEWSPYTHPKDFPSGHAEGLLHWSNVVGASHNKFYSIWGRGDLASEGVRDICEYGDTAKLEREFKKEKESSSQTIRTVVKAGGIWDRELRQSRQARFSVNQTHHLLSMLTMLGPSPDWCVGVSAVDLCLPDCTWKEQMEVDLYPWDAGTDAGLTYLSENQPEDPQKPITMMNSSWPSDEQSPWYGVKKLKPLAKLVLRRIAPRSGEPCLDESSAGSDDPVLPVSRGCMTSNWNSWGTCSTTCGKGTRVRRRMLKTQSKKCMRSTDTMESEGCFSKINVCPDDRPGGAEGICQTTGWSEWGSCSVTCGFGARTRTRKLVTYANSDKCEDAKLAEHEVCQHRIFPKCPENNAVSYNDICNMDVVRGPCAGNYPRWHFDRNQKRCVPFSYGGCRGNQNRFFTRDQCAKSCTESR